MFIHSREDQWSSGILWSPRVRYAFDANKKTFAPWDLDWFERRIGPFLPTCDQLGVPPITGRLGCTVEGGGKRRIFAIGNYINQRLLAPVHEWSALVLRSVDQDGTFNQTKPLDNLVGSKNCYSFDLKSATDRWPLVMLFEISKFLFDRSFASAVVNSALACNIFYIPFVKRKFSQICFVAGQPLGYHSSWPLFALSHHFLVWWCAEQVYPGVAFKQYTVLGDDVVITDQKVASVYEKALGDLGVTISYQKSLISNSGSAEFAKRFRVRELRKDISPVSIRSLLNFHHPCGLFAVHLKYSFKRFSTLARVGGANYRVLARLDHRRSAHYGRIWAMWTRRELPFELWLGRGRPLNPYLRGVKIDFLRKEMRPQELILAPEHLFEMPGMRDFLEWSSLRVWVKNWLKYCHWYFGTALEPGVSIEHFLRLLSLHVSGRSIGLTPSWSDLVFYGNCTIWLL